KAFCSAPARKPCRSRWWRAKWRWPAATPAAAIWRAGPALRYLPPSRRPRAIAARAAPAAEPKDPMKFLDNAPRFLFFTGKGGVGKTSLACATAMQLAAQGQRVLLVSTDPASNVGQVFGVAIGNQVTAVPEVPRLWALEVDPQAAAQGYRDRIVGPVRSVLPDDVVKGIEEQLSGACTTEIAAFDEFTALLTDDSLDARYEHIVFDTAPTGHTIRLLQLPGAWSGFLEAGKGDASCLGPLAGLE